MGYGASGAGKTSALVYFSDGKTPEEQQGVIVHILSSQSICDVFEKVEMTVFEFMADTSDPTKMFKTHDFNGKRISTHPMYQKFKTIKTMIYSSII